MVERLVNTEVNTRRIERVESSFGISGIPLAVPGRVLVGEGVLVKMCRKTLKPRQFFLFNDILIYGSIVINRKKFARQHIIPLEEVQLQDLPDDGDLRYGWLIKTPNKSFAVYAATPTEKTEWMGHIEQCIQELLQKTGKKPSSVHAAVWVPDAGASRCMCCNKTSFTVLNRRHHCRNCGSVVCGACSKYKAVLPGHGDRAVRVCVTCFDQLKKNGTVVKDGERDSTGSNQGNDSQLNTSQSSSNANDSSLDNTNAARKANMGAETSDSEDDLDEKDPNASERSGERTIEDLETLNLEEEKPTFYSDAPVEAPTNDSKSDEKDHDGSDK